MGWKENTIKWLKDRAADCEHKDKTWLGEDCPISSGYHDTLKLIAELERELAATEQALKLMSESVAGLHSELVEARNDIAFYRSGDVTSLDEARETIKELDSRLAEMTANAEIERQDKEKAQREIAELKEHIMQLPAAFVGLDAAAIDDAGGE